MKKFVQIFSVLIVLAHLCACTSDDEPNPNESIIQPVSVVDEQNPNESIIQPVSVVDEVITTFFNSEIPELHIYENYKRSESFFYDPDTYGGKEILKNLVYVINSQQELADVYIGEKALPEIDFDRYTLIIGQEIMPFLGFYVAKKELLANDNGLVLSLCAINEGEILPTAVQHLYFWDLYPKLSQRNISVIVTKDYPNRPDLQ